MKRLLLILILTLSFQTLTKADDIRDFEIEGMSIGDSLLDFISLKKINQKINSYSDKGYIYKSKKYYALTFNSDDFSSNLKLYDQIQFHLKHKDISYIIESLGGIKLYKENISECHSFLAKREKEANSVFGKSNKENFFIENKRNIKKTVGYFYTLSDNSNMFIGCENWNKDSNIPDDFALVLNSSEHQDWINNEAYK
tara:strand:- start:726 stop:1319 length:594 start_codon:yes stop_codon:yes gene_type:complete